MQPGLQGSVLSVEVCSQTSRQQCLIRAHAARAGSPGGLLKQSGGACGGPHHSLHVPAWGLYNEAGSTYPGYL